MADYDVIVLGGGSAGSSAASAAAAAGARTAMINDGELGGLCILRGCMPTKALLATAHAVHEARHLEPFGARLVGNVEVDFTATMARKAGMVERFKRAKVRAIDSADYEVIDGRGRFAAEGGVQVGGRRLTAQRYVLATGSHAVHLPIPGADQVRVLTSDDVMQLETQPSSLIVQGAGPIGLELAQFFARIGTRVLLVNRSPLLSKVDAACGEELTRALATEDNLELAVPGRIEKLELDGKGLSATVVQGNHRFEYKADALLMAAGRRAALSGIGLEHLGLDPNASSLDHDDTMRSSHPDLYVAGDVTGSHQILHISNQEGRVAGHNAAGGAPPRRVDYQLMMQVVFTDPPFAFVGPSSLTADVTAGRVAVGEARFPETGRAITMSTEHGLWRLFADPAGGRLLGSAILGPRADDLAHMITILMHHEAGISTIPELPWYHPTLSEVMLDLHRSISRQVADNV